MEGLDTLLRARTDSGEIPGVCAVAIDAGGTLYEGAFGLRALGDAAPMTLDTMVWLASMTKPLTSVAALQLVERGRLDLDSPAGRWLPALAQVQVLEGFDADGQPRTRPPRSPVTLRHLLTHTSGYGYDIYSVALQQYQAARGLPSILSCQPAALDTPLLFDPGERWEYGIGLDWVGRLVEAASGMTLGAWLSEHVLQPLGMHDTGFRLTAAQRERRAKVHQRADGRLSATDFGLPPEPAVELGGAGLYGTALDYQKFLRMILRRGRADGGPLLRPETVDAMCANQSGAHLVGPVRTCMPLLSNDSEFFPAIPKHFSFAFQVASQATPTGMSAGTLMWAGLANTIFWIDPARGLAGVFLTQVLPFGDRKCGRLFLEFQSTLYRNLDARRAGAG